MPTGYQIKTAGGVIDLGKRLGRVLGSIAVSAPSGSITHDGLSQGEPWALVGSEAATETAGDPWAWAPSVSINGNTLSWDAQGRPFGAAHIIFGVR